MLDLNLSPFSLSDIDWDLNEMGLDFGGSWSDDGCFFLGQSGGGMLEITDANLGLGINPVGLRGNLSAMGDNLGWFDDYVAASVSSKEGLSIEDMNFADYPSSSSVDLPGETSDSDYCALEDDAYDVRLHANMWGKGDIPARAFDYGPDKYNKRRPQTVLSRLRAYNLPTDWKYASPSPNA
ncbi:unnamed protein product [Linum trigynum]|uniref:Uncharacterized protein n=1 Tax=Linum trigynum TaxID=586398 RepID=A0AAV2CSE1_9ROSI